MVGEGVVVEEVVERESGEIGECGRLTIHIPVVKSRSPLRMILSSLYIVMVYL